MFYLLRSTLCYTCCSQLLESTCRIANVLKREGVKKGDRVAIYMSASPLLAATMLACARIGAIHRYVYGCSCLHFQLTTNAQPFRWSQFVLVCPKILMSG